MHIKKHGNAVLFISSKYVGTTFQTSFSYFSYKKSKQKNFTSTTPFYFSEAFEVPRNFSRKVFCVGVWGGSPPTDYAYKKTRHRHAFLKSFAVFAEKFLVIFFLVFFFCRTEMDRYSDSGYDYISHNVEYDGKNCGSGA